MQIDTSLGQYSNNGRMIPLEKTASPAEQASENARSRVPLNPSLSRAILSNSLANVLWEVGGSKAETPRHSQSRSGNGDRHEAELNWVRSAYAENE